MSLESYEMLGIEPDATFQEVRIAFRTLALQVHPDKGGNPRLFMLVQNAYKDILHALDAKTRHQFHNMKKNYNEIQTEQTQRVKVEQQGRRRRGGAPELDPEHFNRAKFNEIFEKYRVHTPNDDGYDLTEETVSAEQFETAVTQYDQPDIIACSGGYTELGQAKINDFTAPFYSKVKYTDCQRAYAEPTAEEKLFTRPEYTSMKKLQQERKNMKLKASETEQQEFARVQKHRHELEKIRQATHKRQLQDLMDTGNRMRNFIGYRK